MRSPSRKIAAAIAALGLSSSLRSIHAATVYTWNGSGANWQTPADWTPSSPAGGPTSSDQALFNDTGAANKIVAVGGSVSAASINFGGTSTRYSIGSTVGDGTISLSATGSSSAGAVAVASTVTGAQTINSNIQTAGSGTVYITNLSNLGSTNGTPGLTIAGNITPPSSGSVEFVQTATAMTLVSGNIGANGSGGLIGSTGTLRLTGQNTYTGGTSYSGNGVGLITQIGSSSNALPGASFTSGPLGTGPLTVNNNTLEPVGGDQAISNAIIISANGGYTFQTAPTTGANADTTGPHNLELDGPISYASGATTGRTLTGSMNTTAGSILTFGSASAPSTLTITTASTTSAATQFKNPLTSGTLLEIFNDVIQDSPSSPAAKVGNSTVDDVNYGFNAAAGGSNIFRFNSQNTYNGNGGTADGTILQQPNARYQLNVDTAAATVLTINGVATGNTIQGPFGSSNVVPNNANAVPILEAYGADRTLANPINVGSSGFAVDNASSYTDIAADNSGPHNLSLTGNITVPVNRTISNNMVSSTALYLGGGPSGVTVANPAANINIASGTILTIEQQVSASPGISGLAVTAGNGRTVIYDSVTGGGGLTVKDGASVMLNNSANSYSGPTTVTNSSAAPTVGGALYVNGAITGTGAVTANGIGTGATAVGTGGTLGGTGSIAGAITISSTTAASQGGIVDPGPGGTTPGTLNVGGMTWDPYGRYVYDYNGSNNATGGGTNSEIAGANALSLAALSSAAPFDLNLQEVTAGTSPGPYVLADFAGGITGSSGGYANGTDVTNLFTFSGTATTTPDVMVVSDGSTNGQELQLTFAAVPEPTSALLICGGLTGLFMRRRSRR